MNKATYKICLPCIAFLMFMAICRTADSQVIPAQTIEYTNQHEIIRSNINNHLIQVDLPRSSLSPRDMGVVINESDPISLELGAYYVEAHGIPSENIIYVNFTLHDPRDPQNHHMEISDFLALKEQIVANTPAHIQAYVITWGYPWMIEYWGQIPKQCASITTGLTYPIVPDYQSPYDNICQGGVIVPTPLYKKGFYSQPPFERFGLRPSMMLWAGSVEDTKELIDRSVLSNQTFPTGEGYFHTTSDSARSGMRVAEFKSMPEAWNHQGGLTMHWIDESAISTVCTWSEAMKNKDNVLFYLTGCMNMHLYNTIYSINYVPGALADNLTSYGGRFDEQTHTPLHLWLKTGASATYGNIYEPGGASADRFPNSVHLVSKYFMGATALEAYVNSVYTITKSQFAGDPLARPYGTRLEQDGQDLILVTSIIYPGKEYIISQSNSENGAFEEIRRISVEKPQIVRIRISNPKAYVKVHTENQSPQFINIKDEYWYDSRVSFNIPIQAKDIEDDSYNIRFELVGGGSFAELGIIAETVPVPGGFNSHIAGTMDDRISGRSIRVIAEDSRGAINEQVIKLGMNIYEPARLVYPVCSTMGTPPYDCGNIALPLSLQIIPGKGVLKVLLRIWDDDSRATIYDGEIGVDQVAFSLAALPVEHSYGMTLESQLANGRKAVSSYYFYLAEGVDKVNLISPANGQLITNGTVNFTWTQAPKGLFYTLSVGSSPVYGDIFYGAFPLAQLSYQVQGIPVNGNPIFVKLCVLNLYQTYSACNQYQFMTDGTPPTGSISFNNITTGYTTSSSATLRLFATDAGGVAQMRFSNDNVSWTAWDNYEEKYKGWPFTAGDGVKTVYVQFKDTAGNASGSFSNSIIVDKIPPTVSFTINNGVVSTSSQSVTLRLSASDATSGMGSGAQMQFSNDGVAWSAAQAYAVTKTWNLSSGRGLKTVYVKVKDASGIWSAPKSANINFVYNTTGE